MKRWRGREGRGRHVSPLGILEAAAVKLSAASVCNLSSYTVANRWEERRGGGGGGGGRQKYLVNCLLQGIISDFFFFYSLSFLTLFNKREALTTHLSVQFGFRQSRTSHLLIFF